MGLKFLDKYAIEGRHYDQKTELDKSLNDESWPIRYAAIKHPNATMEHIDKALNDGCYDVRRIAIQHPNVTKENVDKALSDPYSLVRNLASDIAKEKGWL